MTKRAIGRLLVVSATAVGAITLAHAPASAILTCEDQSAVTGQVLTKGPGAACYSTTFGLYCAAYTYEQTTTGSTRTCYVPLDPIEAGDELDEHTRRIVIKIGS